MSSFTNSQAQNDLASHARDISFSPNRPGPGGPAPQNQPQQQQQQQQQQPQSGCNWWDVTCLLQQAFAPVGQLTAFLNPLWQWIQNPVRIVKMIGGILALGVGLILLIKPEALPDIPGIKT